MPIRNLTTEERYQGILRIDRVLNSSLDLDVVLGRVATELKAILPLDHVALLLINSDEKSYTWANITSGGEEGVDLPDKDIPLEGGTLGWFIEHRSEVPYVIYQDLLRERPFAEDEIVFQRGIRSGVRVPLIIEDEVFGELAVASFEPNCFTEEMAQFLSDVAPHIATAVANARAYATLQASQENLHKEALLLRSELKFFSETDFVGSSRGMADLKDMIRRVAQTEVTVLILGETGTGKELVAHAIHNLSARREKLMVKVNCAALQDTLLLSELFGHEKGAFTGANRRQLGKVELAAGGSLFLDEIGDLIPEAQVKLLQVLEEGTFSRVGGTEVLTADVRVVAATNRDLQQMVADGGFREDLFFRLQGFTVRLPPLRERREDIPLLANYFLEGMAAHLNKEVTQLTSGALSVLQTYAWPGNVRELEQAIKRGVIVCPGSVIRVEDLALEKGHVPEMGEDAPILPEEYERQYILQLLERTGWVIRGPKGAAALWGIPEGTLRSRMKKHGIQRPRG